MRTDTSADVIMEASLAPKRKREHDQEAAEESQPKSTRTTKIPSTGTGFLSENHFREHLLSLQHVGGDLNQQSVLPESTSVCTLCGLSTLMLTPKPKFCSGCGFIIKSNASYYYHYLQASSEQLCFCVKCFSQSRKSITFFNGLRVPKNKLNLAKNVEDVEEPWVQCDTCDEWNHQICGLYNSFEEKYKCPKCRLRERDTDRPIFCAKDVPQTNLGGFIEQRLLRRLKEDKEQRAMAAGKSLDEVPGADDLFVRVMLSVKKKITVGDNLCSVLSQEKRPIEFPYTSKMILLFQKIDGVDVCLFSMYVQEYGSECNQPNQRYAYISYIDSVKYFTPDVASSTGEALRTLTYHEILIGYMEYVKKRGFARCYLWACPPMKGDQYILNCHPSSQRTPNPDRLRLWYQKMLKKATAEGIVVDRSTLYDRFFLEPKISVARLPYFDGDYWPGVAERLLMDIEKQENNADSKNKKKPMTKTSLKVLGFTDPSEVLKKENLLMLKLGQAILPFRENFMVIDLHYFCAQCHELILSGKRWLCNDPKNSYICQICHDKESPSNTSSKIHRNSTYKVVVPVPIVTEDEDGTLENENCETSQKFLQFCQQNRYQFDTLRRAKHSSLMILHRIRPVQISRVALSPEESRVVQRSELMVVFKHVSQCGSSNEVTSCNNRMCSTIREMFVHATKCDTQVHGGCLTCQKVWYILHLHSNLCSDPNCSIPYCKELKCCKEKAT